MFFFLFLSFIFLCRA